jgi:hypothetical protein
MRIAYVARYDFEKPSGVLDKILCQISEWRASGDAVRLFVLTRDNATAIPSSVGFVSARTRPYARRHREVSTLMSEAAAWVPDVIYLRQCTYQPGFKKLSGLAPIVVEINADDIEELHLVSWKSHFYNLATRRLLLNRIDAFVFVTQELACSSSFARFLAPRVVIGNGISLADVPLRTCAPVNPEPRLFFIGSPGYAWHGVDKILLLAQRRPRWHFDIVGALSSTEDLLPPNVVTHGLLNREQYGGLLHSADVAISTLALHRDGLNEASPLKTREYLAAGVPTMTAYGDTDFPRGAPFLLELPNEEDNVVPQLRLIDEFVERMRGVVVSRDSVAHLDWSEKEPTRLALFERIVASGRQRSRSQ